MMDNSSRVGGKIWDAPLSPGLVVVVVVVLPSSCSRVEPAVRKLTTGSGVISLADVVPSPCPLINSEKFSAAVKQTCASATSIASNMNSRLPIRMCICKIQ